MENSSVKATTEASYRYVTCRAVPRRAGSGVNEPLLFQQFCSERVSSLTKRIKGDDQGAYEDVEGRRKGASDNISRCETVKSRRARVPWRGTKCSTGK